MGIDAYSAEEFWLKYGHDDLLPREHLFRFFFFLKHTPPHRCAHLLSGATGCSAEAWWASVHHVRSYLNGVVAEIRWAERLSEWNHVPHFPYFVTHYVDSMPIASIGGILCDVLFNPIPWEHVPAHVWTAPTQEDNDDEDVVGDDGDVCALCCTKFDPEKMSMCDKCELQYCTDCIDTCDIDTCDSVTFL